MKTIFVSIIIIKSKVSYRKYLFRVKSSIVEHSITKKKMIINSHRNKLKQIILLLRSKIFKNKNPDLKISKILKIFMLKLLSNNSNLIKNHPQTITIKDGFGCSFLGYVWRWNVTIQINSENVSLHLPHTCQ
jgi:hypothetical protein